MEFVFEDLEPPVYKKPPIEGILAELGRDLTAIDRTHPIVGRDAEIRELREQNERLRDEIRELRQNLERR